MEQFPKRETKELVKEHHQREAQKGGVVELGEERASRDEFFARMLKDKPLKEVEKLWEQEEEKYLGREKAA